ncbi:MAG: hypothetical protein R2827_07430 [Bdellovibrionales bacterium]
MRKQILVLLMLFTFGCVDAKSPRLMAPPLPDPTPQPKIKSETKSTGLDVVYNPRVDILFIIDNSRSMVEDIKTLQSNIQKFVEALSNNTAIDYHIAATTVFDKKRYTNSEDGVFKIDPNDGRTQLYLEKGELIPLKNAAGERLWNAPRFVTNDNLHLLPSLFEVVEYDDPQKSTFELLVNFEEDNVASSDPSSGLPFSKVAFGANDEETLSPIQSIIWPENSVVSTANSGFLRRQLAGFNSTYRCR